MYYVMDAKTAIAKLGNIVLESGDFSEEDIETALIAAGFSGIQAKRTYVLVQTAWARSFLGNLRIQFSPEYICLNALGNIVESGQLEQDPYYIEAQAFAKQYLKTSGGERLALMSSEVDAINQALKAGSKAKDLVLAPILIFLEPPTDEGLKNAQQVLNQVMEKIERDNPSPKKKPWWMFWG
jgi:hypothetical protein